MCPGLPVVWNRRQRGEAVVFQGRR
jgi:hypothetical protein